MTKKKKSKERSKKNVKFQVGKLVKDGPPQPSTGKIRRSNGARDSGEKKRRVPHRKVVVCGLSVKRRLSMAQNACKKGLDGTQVFPSVRKKPNTGERHIGKRRGARLYAGKRSPYSKPAKLPLRTDREQTQDWPFLGKSRGGEMEEEGRA